MAVFLVGAVADRTVLIKHEQINDIIFSSLLWNAQNKEKARDHMLATVMKKNPTSERWSHKILDAREVTKEELTELAKQARTEEEIK